MIRVIAFAIAAAFLAAGFFFHQKPWCFFIYGVLILFCLVFERHRYRKRIDATRGKWEPTGERFIDPGSNLLTVVYYNEQTGERDYRTKP